MSEVKKISPVGNIYGWEESQFGEFVLSQDYDALADEAQALREEVAQQKFLTKVENDALKMMTDKANGFEVRSRATGGRVGIPARKGGGCAGAEASKCRRPGAES